MAILARCPRCKNYWSTQKKICKCGENLDRDKRSKRVRYTVQYRNPEGKRIKKSLEKLGLDPYSIQDAQDVQAKLKVNKRENIFFDVPPDVDMTFNDLTKW